MNLCRWRWTVWPDSRARGRRQWCELRITEEELEELGIPVNKPGENDMGLDFNDFLQLMVQQLQNQTIDNTTDTGRNA